MALSFNVLKIPDFRFLMSSRMFTNMALQAQAIIVAWQVYSITHSPWMLGLTGLAEAVPALTCALFSGHVVDGNRPQFVLFASQVVLTLNTLMLFLIGGGILTHPGMHILPFLYTGVFISGVARSFMMPSAFSLLSKIVTKNQMAAASGWLNSGFQFGVIASPSLAGLLYGGYGATVAWVLPTSFIIVALLCNCQISLPAKAAKNGEKREPAWQSIRNGWKFIFKNQIMLAVMALDMFSVLFGGAVAMLPAYADQVLHVGSQGLGILRAAPAIGSICVALLLAMQPMQKVRTRNLLLVIVGFGLCMIDFGLSKSFALSICLLALSGAFDSVSVITRSTIFQLLTPDDMRGRVSAVNSMFVISSNEIGAFESGLAARLFGLVPSVVIGGFACLGVVAATAFFSPKMRSLVVDAEEVTK